MKFFFFRNSSVDPAPIRKALLGWYEGHRRKLPWRETNDAYRIWVSEVMLQQTRAAAVLEHYQKFLRRFPSVERLAAARSSSVMAAWSGLGYYRRARSMHAAAKKIVRDFGGHFPNSSAGLRRLPGIGRYTAAAVASIAFNEACAVMDGNIKRVLTRFFGNANQTDGELWRLAESLLSRRRPGDFNQAMMELGATVCLPEPKCGRCPLFRWCATRGSFAVAQLPVRKKRSQTCALMLQRGLVWLVQRTAEERLMPGMWELPGMAPNVGSNGALWKLRHSITNTDYDVSVVRIPASKNPTRNQDSGAWIKYSRLEQIPLTGLTRKILRRANLIK